MEPVQSPEVKAVIGFGTKDATAGPTPKAIKLFYRIVMFLGGLWALLEPYFPTMPIKLAHNIDKAILLSTVIIYYVCQQFGWVIPKNQQTTQV